MAKVLILEQSKSVRNNLRERLEFEGFSTEGAETVALARKMCENIAFDIILSDSTDGLADTNLPVIVLSCDTEAAGKHKVPCFTVPFNHNTAEPVSLSDLIRQALEQVICKRL